MSRLFYDEVHFDVPTGFMVRLDDRTHLRFHLLHWRWGRSEWPHDWPTRTGFPGPILRWVHLGPFHLSRVRAKPNLP